MEQINGITIIRLVNGLFLLTSCFLIFRVINTLRKKYGQKHCELYHWTLTIAPIGLVIGFGVKFGYIFMSEFYYNLALTPSYFSIMLIMWWAYLFHKKKL